MLNSVKTHIYILRFFKLGLIFLLIIANCKAVLNPNELPDRFPELDTNGLNYKITNDLSEFSGSKFIEKEANGFLQQWNLAGLTMSIINDGKLVYAHGFGYSDVETKQQVTPGNLFRIASVSKLITAVAIMKLVEKKAISLDSKVFGPKAILKDPIFNSVVDKRLYNINVRHLLAH